MKLLLTFITLFIFLSGFTQELPVIKINDPNKENHKDVLLTTLCDSFEYNVNKFTKDTTYNMPSYFRKITLPVRLVKVKSLFKKSNYYLSLISSGNTEIKNGDVTLLFSDDSKIIFRNQEIRFGDDLQTWRCFVSLTFAQVKMLSIKTLTDWQLYVGEGDFNKIQSDLFKEFAICILSK